MSLVVPAAIYSKVTCIPFHLSAVPIQTRFYMRARLITIEKFLRLRRGLPALACETRLKHARSQTGIPLDECTTNRARRRNDPWPFNRAEWLQQIRIRRACIASLRRTRLRRRHNMGRYD